MAEYRGPGSGDRGQDPLRLPLAVEFEATMDARYDEIEGRQHVRRIVQRTVGEDVGFDALEDPEASGLPVEVVDSRLLRADGGKAETASVARRLRMVGHAEVLVAALPRGLGHRLQCVGAVGCIGVDVQETVQGGAGDESRQAFGAGAADFIAALAQLWCDKG